MPIESNLSVIDKAAWQSKLFAQNPRRSELLALKPHWTCQPLVLRVHRNAPFEFVAGILSPFLAYAGFEAAIELGDYDDSLNFSNTREPVDCELIWLDYGRYAGKLADAELYQWLKERMEALRVVSQAPILIADGGGVSPEFNESLVQLEKSIPALRIFPRRKLEKKLGARWIDRRMNKIGAHTMSDEAVISCAQSLGLVWLPAAVDTALKAIVLDLDNTLFHGVLGEDGIAGVTLSPAHKALQEKILTYKKQGLFIALLSRNELSDVEKLFSSRKDFPLCWADFSAVSVNWSSKSSGLQNIADQLRIHPDSMLIVDDNLGEIAEMASRHPSASFWHAGDVEMNLQAFELLPRLLRWHKNDTDKLRAADIDASRTRTVLQTQAIDTADYVRSLAITLTFHSDPQDLCGRLTDLANKTNQFALSLARFGESEVARRLKDPHCVTFSVSLSDRLSDSGVIAAIFFRSENQTLYVDEICISCRALGRHMEDMMIFNVLAEAQRKFAADEIAFVYNRGPRNAPAREWLEKLAGAALPDDQGLYIAEWTDLCHKTPHLPVTTIWQPAEEAA